MAEQDINSTDSKKSYNQILKTTAVFGGVKVFSVLIGLFKAKIIAIFLGPAGMGIFNLINYPINLISQFSGLGISTSGIREVAQTKDEKQLQETAEVIKYWNRTLGVIGSLLLLLAAPWISRISFGDDSYAWAFCILSVVVFLTNLGSEYEVLLRGRRETKLVAKAGFYSSLAGFIASIPFYYYFGTPGIVVVILITALTLAGVNYLYAKRLNIKSVKLPLKEIFHRGTNMVSIGFFIVLGDLIFVGAITLVNTFIRTRGGLEDVGYFQACMQLTQSSLNIVLIAMAADYFPRLSKMQDNPREMGNIATQQSEIAVLLCTPIIVGMIAFAPLVIKILLSNEFMVIESALCLFFVGTVFRIPTWAMNYVVLAKGQTKLYVSLVTIFNILLLLVYIAGYYYFGLKGIAIGYIIITGVYAIIQNTILGKKLNIRLGTSFWRLYVIGVVLSVAAITPLLLQNSVLKFSSNAILLIIAIGFAVYHMNKKTSIIEKVKQKISR